MSLHKVSYRQWKGFSKKSTKPDSVLRRKKLFNLKVIYFLDGVFGDAKLCHSLRAKSYNFFEILFNHLRHKRPSGEPPIKITSFFSLSSKKKSSYILIRKIYFGRIYIHFWGKRNERFRKIRINPNVEPQAFSVSPEPTKALNSDTLHLTPINKIPHCIE